MLKMQRANRIIHYMVSKFIHKENPMYTMFDKGTIKINIVQPLQSKTYFLMSILAVPFIRGWK